MPGRGTPVSPAVAVVGAATITAEQLQRSVGNRLIGLETQRFQLQSQVLDELISDAVLRSEAAARGISVEELLKTEVEAKVGPPSDEEVKQVYQNVKARFPDKTEAEVGALIVPQLRGRRLQERRAQLVAELRTKASVKVLLEPPRAEVPARGPSRGAPAAPVTIVEFSDFQCPYCGHVHPTLKKLLERYGTAVRLVFRDYPLPNHPQAPKAAEAAACAGEQGKFWEMHDRLFENQGRLQPADLKTHAGELGLDAEAFATCLDSGRMAAAWRANFDAGEAAGINGTPAFFVNGRFLGGAQPYEVFAHVVEDELQRKGLPVPPPPAAATATDK